MSRRLHPFWACWFLAVGLLPVSIGGAVFISDIVPQTQWYEYVAGGYAALHCMALVISAAIGGPSIPLLRERQTTEIEVARRELDKEFPG